MYYTKWEDIPRNHYSVIYADPPWPYKDKMSGHSFSLDHEYQTQPLKWIQNLPVRDIAAKDCVLLLWVPNPQLPDGLDVMKAWAFRFKTVAFVWSKLTKHHKRVANLGRWTMGNVEMVLLGTRGKPQRLSRNVKQFIEAERREHSRKPDELKRRIEELIGGPRIELFARGQSGEAWDQFGDDPDYLQVEVPKLPYLG